MMKSGVIGLLLVALCGSADALAQNAVGGPHKPAALGGPVKPNSPVLPAAKAGALPVAAPPPAKCPSGHCPAKGSTH